MLFKSKPNDTILNSSEFKAFTDDEIKMTQKLKFLCWED